MKKESKEGNHKYELVINHLDENSQELVAFKVTEFEDDKVKPSKTSQ
jgi:hypothetical protein